MVSIFFQGKIHKFWATMKPKMIGAKDDCPKEVYQNLDETIEYIESNGEINQKKVNVLAIHCAVKVAKVLDELKDGKFYLIKYEINHTYSVSIISNDVYKLLTMIMESNKLYDCEDYD